MRSSKQSWSEWFANLFPRSRLNVDEAFDRVRENLANVEASFDQLPAADGSDGALEREKQRAEANNSRALQLQGQIAGLECTLQPVTLPDSLTEIKDLVNDAAATLNVARDLPAIAAQCGATPKPIPPVQADPPPDTPTLPGTKPGGGVQFDPGPPKVLSASMDCGPILELRPGQNSKTCNIVVKGWLSNTTTPVEVIVGPLLPGLRASPGNTLIAGDSMYAGGVSDRADQYVFTEGFAAAAGTPAGTSQALLILVRQRGHGVVELPLTLNVIASGAPDGITISPPKPDVAGTGGPFCVWQYKLFGDPPECWNFAAAVCTSSRYAGREEYIRVGNDMTWGQADGRIAELSRHFADAYGCRPQVDLEKPSQPPPPPPVVQQGTGGNYCVWRYKMFGDPPACFHFVAAQCGKYRHPYELVGANMTSGQADNRITELSRFFNDGYGCRSVATPTTEEPPAGPTPNPNTPDPPKPPDATTPDPPTPKTRTLSRFGILPANPTIKPGQAVQLKAYGVYADAPNDIVEINNVGWSGDKPPIFTAAPGDVGKRFVISATGPGGASDSTTVTVAEETSIFDDLTNQPPVPVPPGTVTPPTEKPPVTEKPAQPDDPAKGGGTGTPKSESCDAKEQAVWAKISGTWQSDWGDVGFTGSCENVSGYWFQGPYNSRGNEHRGVIRKGRVKGTGLSFEWFQPWNEREGTDYCTLMENGVLSCSSLRDLKRK